MPVPGWVNRRFNPETVQVREVQGIAERIVDGKLHLTLKDFLELVLRNSTEVNLTRLDVYTAADQIRAAQAVFDPFLSLGFNALRSHVAAVIADRRRVDAEHADAEFVPELSGAASHRADRDRQLCRDRAVPITARSICSIRVFPAPSISA